MNSKSASLDQPPQPHFNFYYRDSMRIVDMCTQHLAVAICDLQPDVLVCLAKALLLSIRIILEAAQEKV
eukprot:scaffold1863_cov85-Cylindrotheca_fusiformis.AAC.9